MSKLQYKFGTFDFCYPFPGPPAIRLAGEAGFDGICIGDLYGCEKNYPLNQKCIQQQYLEASRKYNVSLEVFQLFSMSNLRGRYDHFDPDSREAEKGRTAVRRAAEACEAMGIPRIMIGTTVIRDANERNNIKENFKEYVKICAQHGVRLTIEDDMTVEQLIPFLDEVGHGLKACFDTNNPIFYGTGYSPDMIRALGKDRIDHFHMKESRANEFGVLTRKEELVTVLGEGDSHFAEAVDAIHDIGFQGWIFAETFYFFKGFQGRDYVEIGKHTLRNLRRAYLDAQ